MKAKDTVMGEAQLIEVIYFAIETPDKDADEGWKNKQRFRAVCNAQAEISFKAGYDKAMAQLADMTEECKQLGRREVVEWIKKYRSETTREFMGFTTSRETWQSKLKEWNLETDSRR